jgi:hypothetical protein
MLKRTEVRLTARRLRGMITQSTAARPRIVETDLTPRDMGAYLTG